MSDTNDINFKGTDEEAEGHGWKRGLDDGSGTEEAEGHGWRKGLDDGSGTDAEGEDAEGHGKATRF